MNRNTKLKLLAPRPAADQGCHQMMSYSCSSMGTEGRTGSINRNAFVGANLGVHASPLEAVTSMDPKDYVWGGGYNDSFYGCQPSAFAGAQACYYTQEYSGQHGHYGKLVGFERVVAVVAKYRVPNVFVADNALTIRKLVA